ncbi:endolytic transglycosylase MltG [Streptomyces viridosporus]|uniref:endolytic transglycosylase MltG n=1 Tax=Streptomyces viridosporus TaxID=67581 RepID=UPI0009C0BC47|nr:endolytic transglycosylase MltG [Streptomyces viridosporus]
MTEYGRGQGSEPWHPDDPLYGDGGWGGQQTQQGHHAHPGQQSPYGGRPQHHPQEPQQHYDTGGWDTTGQNGYTQPQQYPQYDQQYAPQQQYDTGGWPAGSHSPDPYAAGPADPYGQQNGAYGGEQADHYRTPDAYPPPEPPGRRRAEPEPRTDGGPGPDEGEHAFFAGDTGEDEDDRDDEGGRDDEGDRDDEPGDRRGRGERRGRGGNRGGKEKKRRNGVACLVVVLVLGGGTIGISYFGYQFYKDRFGSAPDFAGDGNGEQVTVTIPKGAGGYVIGQELKKMGVVKSVDAFVAAQADNPQGNTIQDGVYTLQKEMSAESAVALMLSPKSRSNLIIAEGWRNAYIYELIDQRLEVEEGTTAKVAKEDWEKLGLPDWAQGHENVKDPLEGFLFPSSYGVSKGQKPEDVLKRMVAQAAESYEKLEVEKKAESLGLENPWQLVTVASMVQAEGTSHSDFRKMAEVIYNRLEPGNTETNGMLEFDSTYNYIKNQSKLDLSLKELRNYDNPYNTYYYKGLTPGPIGNPGEDAIKGALNPTDEGWYYFISLDGKTSEFTKTNAEHQKLVDKWNASRKN